MYIKTKMVCKECYKSGYNLKLNENLLCDECIDYYNKELNSNELRSDIENWIDKKGNLKRINICNKLRKKKEKRTEKNFYKIFNAYQKARELERQGKPDDALKIYLKLLVECPPGTEYYARPCIILEKKHEYLQAIEICDLAIKSIREERYQADESEFTHRKNRLLSKLEKQKKKER